MNSKTDVEDVKKCLDWFLFKQCDMERVKDAYDSNTVWNAVCFARDALDAEPVRHGKWELAEDGWYCSACELYPPFDCDPEEKGIPYCPNCGARMDEHD